MRDRKLPESMKRRLRSFFLLSKELHQAQRYTSLLVQMSPQLQGEVARATNLKWITKVWYLRPRDTWGESKSNPHQFPQRSLTKRVSHHTTFTNMSDHFGGRQSQLG